jgi:hypothetical protein
MEPFENRNKHSQQALQEGLLEERNGNLQAAYEYFRIAHDLVVDCPRLHQMAHQHLRRVNTKRRNYRELVTDLFLLGFARLGIFELVAFMMKKQVLGGIICRRNIKNLLA